MENIMEKFKLMINTNDKALAEELIASDAEFQSLTSPEILYGGKGFCLSWTLCARAFLMFTGR